MQSMKKPKIPPGIKLDTWVAASSPRPHLREWRKYRGLTQEQLAEAVGTTGSVISLLEAGKRQLTTTWLNRLAAELRTSPGFLMDHHPKRLPLDVLDVWADIPDDLKEHALTVLRTFARKTGG